MGKEKIISLSRVEGGLRTKGIYKSDKEKEPLVTYITVCLNCKETLKTCMDSVLSQTYSNIEYIVIDGGSNDGTLEMIRTYESKIDYFISEPDSGIYNAMNKGLALANGTLICFMNSDDQVLPNAAQIAVTCYLSTHAEIICGDRKLIHQGKFVEETLKQRYPIKNCVFSYLQCYHQATYASKKSFDLVGSYDEDYRYMADYVWQIKAITLGIPVAFLTDQLCIFSMDGASTSGLLNLEREWMKFANSVFPEVSLRDSEYLRSFFNFSRFNYRNYAVLFRVTRKYANNPVFHKVIRELVYAELINTIGGLDNKINNYRIGYPSIYRLFFMKWDHIKNEKIKLENTLLLSCSDSESSLPDNYLISLGKKLNGITRKLLALMIMTDMYCLIDFLLDIFTKKYSSQNSVIRNYRRTIQRRAGRN